MSGSIDLFDDISSDESFDDDESSSESLTVDSSDDDSDDKEIQSPVLDLLAPHWSSVLDAVDVPPFLCGVGPFHSLPTTANERDFFELLFSESCLHQITEGTNKHASEVQQRKGIIIFT